MSKLSMNDLIMNCALAWEIHRHETSYTREVFIYRWLDARKRKVSGSARKIVYDILNGFGKRLRLPQYFNTSKIEFTFDMYLAAILGGPHKLPKTATKIDPQQYAKMFS